MYLSLWTSSKREVWSHNDPHMPFRFQMRSPPPKLNMGGIGFICYEKITLFTDNFPQEHQTLKLSLITLQVTRLNPQKVNKIGPDWGLGAWELGQCLGGPKIVYKVILLGRNLKVPKLHELSNHTRNSHGCRMRKNTSIYTHGTTPFLPPVPLLRWNGWGEPHKQTALPNSH